MLFREELPPPRYALDGDIEDNEIVTEKTYELKLELPDLTGSELLLLAPKCARLGHDCGITPLGAIRLVVSTRPKPSMNKFISAAQDFYEVEAKEEDFVSSQQWTAAVGKGPRGLIVISLPALAESEAAYFGRELILSLKPKKVVLATPGLSFMDSPVCYLANAEFLSGDGESLGVLKNMPSATPPVIVQGAGAAAVSRAQQLHIPAMALIVSADGPSNHEVISELGMNELRARLFETLNIKLISGPQVESSMSVLYV